MTSLKTLPISRHTFRNIRENDELYVDKTDLIHQLISQPGAYFLARPRRFGKSLLISTLDELFQGNQSLFEGLAINNSDYGWEQYPIIRIDFGQLTMTSVDELKEIINWMLDEIALQYDIVLTNTTLITIRFVDLIRKLSHRGKVVILVDEYDKPLLDNLYSEQVKQIQLLLRSFYTVIKGMDAHLHFVLLTGVSQFSRVGIFSGLNNLRDISLLPRYSALVGITQAEIDRDLQAHVQAFAEYKGLTVDDLKGELRSWYNGFCFSADCTQVYNPFSLFSALAGQQLAPFWFETGTPTFLLKQFKRQKVSPLDLENITLSSFAFSTYDIERLDLIPLLYQTGYLTVKAYDPATQRYTLGFPNYEVSQAFNTYLLDFFTDRSLYETDHALGQLVKTLRTTDLPTFFKTLNPFFAKIPYDLYIKKEKFYQSIFVLIFKLIGLQADGEVRTSRGRIDAMIDMPHAIFIFEFKLDGSAEDALTQIKTTGYADPYIDMGKPIYLIGANFSTIQREISAWKSERIPPIDAQLPKI